MNAVYQISCTTKAGPSLDTSRVEDMCHHAGALCSSTFPYSKTLKAVGWISILLLKIGTKKCIIKMQWMLNLSLADQTTTSQSLWHQILIWEKDLQRSESHCLPQLRWPGRRKMASLGARYLSLPMSVAISVQFCIQDHPLRGF